MNNIFGTHEEKTLAQLADVASRAERVALMADGHLGYVMPIGGVAAYDGLVSVVGVGFDIACGNAAIQTDATLADLGRTETQLGLALGRIADLITETISFGVGRANKGDDAPTDDPLFDSEDWLRLRERAGHGEWRRLKQKAQQQLGTVGSGNHYVDVFVDGRDRIWVGVHFGSRGFGHGLATGFLNQSVTGDWHAKAPEEERLLDLRSSIGDDYWALMNLAGRYAYAGREWVARKVVALMGAKEVELVHNHHNFAWREQHDGRDLVVVRKGATPAFPGQLGFVGGSMGDDSVILVGRESSRSAGALYSTVHGAGRVMSRTAAAGKTRPRKIWKCGMRDCPGELPISAPILPGGANPRCPVCGAKTHRAQGAPEVIRPGAVSPEMMSEWITQKGVLLRGGGLDESPHAYRRLPEVLAAQGDTIEIRDVLRPLIVCMAGADIIDPYRD